MDEPSKTLLTAAFGSALTLVVLAITKVIDYFAAIDKDKREFKNSRRDKVYAEIEELKNEVGTIYELSTNWQAYDSKAAKYLEAFNDDHKLIGNYNKYSEVAATARD